VDLLDSVADARRRVIVGVHGSTGSLQALRRAVVEARLRDAAVWSVIAWQPPGGEGNPRGMPCPPSLVRIWQDEAARRLTTSWHEALGGVPADITAHLVAVRGKPGEALLSVADAEEDLIVVGAGRHGLLRRLGHGSVPRHCIARAKCPVLTVPPSALERQFHHGGGRRLVRELAKAVES
jgi:nucleotide-binding universal stress UspA family protein